MLGSSGVKDERFDSTQLQKYSYFSLLVCVLFCDGLRLAVRYKEGCGQLSSNDFISSCVGGGLSLIYFLRIAIPQ